MARKSSKVKSLNYRYEVTVRHGKGRATTTVRGTTSLNTWTNKRQNGPTVRVDHAETFRFTDGQVVKRSEVL